MTLNIRHSPSNSDIPKIFRVALFFGNSSPMIFLGLPLVLESTIGFGICLTDLCTSCDSDSSKKLLFGSCLSGWGAFSSSFSNDSWESSSLSSNPLFFLEAGPGPAGFPLVGLIPLGSGLFFCSWNFSMRSLHVVRFFSGSHVFWLWS